MSPSASDGFEQPEAQSASGPQASQPAEQQPGVASLIALAFEQGRALIQDEIALLKLRGKRVAKKFGIAAVGAVVAVVLLFYFVFWIFHSIELVLAIWLPAWGAALVTLGIIVLLIVVLAGIAGLMIRGASEETSEASSTIMTDVQEVKESLNS